MALAAKQLAAEFVLERADRAAERGDADAALLGRTRKIERVAGGEEVADLVQIHGRAARAVADRDCVTRSDRCHPVATQGRPQPPLK